MNDEKKKEKAPRSPTPSAWLRRHAGSGRKNYVLSVAFDVLGAAQDRPSSS